MQVEEHLPYVAVAVGEGRGDEVFRFLPRHFGDMLKVIAERDTFLVPLGETEIVLRVVLQCGFCGSKKLPTSPIAALT